MAAAAEYFRVHIHALEQAAASRDACFACHSVAQGVRWRCTEAACRAAHASHAWCDACVRVEGPLPCALRSSRHPSHPLERRERPNEVYPTFGGVWTCDVCRTVKRRGEAMVRCPPCGYDLCEECFSRTQIFVVPVHPHALKLVDPVVAHAASGGTYTCDMCRRTTVGRAGAQPARCVAGCDFDLCALCLMLEGARPRARRTRLHAHELHLADKAVIYATHGGRWTCDGCRRVVPPTSTEQPMHCVAGCDFDLCMNCVLDPRHALPDEAAPLPAGPAAVAPEPAQPSPSLRCVMCREASVDCVSVPCGCALFCFACAAAFRASDAANAERCPSCRTAPVNVQRVRQALPCDVCFEGL